MSDKEDKNLNEINDEILSAQHRLDNAINTKFETHPKITAKTNKLGDRVADNLALFAGSWVFIISFCLILALWIFINTVIIHKPFDPYPFILLNLMLSCLAAIQAPIIMMSQNRQEARDRQRSEADYNINIKSEYEIKVIQDKLDLMMKENKLMLEQHQLQLDDIKKNQKLISDKINKL